MRKSAWIALSMTLLAALASAGENGGGADNVRAMRGHAVAAAQGSSQEGGISSQVPTIQSADTQGQASDVWHVTQPFEGGSHH